MKNLFKAVAVISLLVGSAFAQLNYTSPVSNYESYNSGWYNAASYNYSMRVFGGGSSAGGTYSVTLLSPSVTLPDGRRVNLFASGTIPPITIGQGATLETVTPSSVSGCTTGVNYPIANGQNSNGTLCSVTATFSNAHGAGDLLTSGDFGYQEALNDAANNGGGQVYFQFDTGAITLATGAATTTYAQTNFFPIGAYILGVAGRVTTTITSACTGWEFGDGTTAARWTANNTGLTAGTTAVNTGAAWTTAIASTTTGYSMAANKQLVITCAGGNPGAGAIHARVWGYTPVGPAY